MNQENSFIDEIFRLAKFGDYQMVEGVQSNRAKIADIVKEIEQAAREEGKREGIIEFCEGENSKAANIEREAYMKGFRAGEEADRAFVVDKLRDWGWKKISGAVRAIPISDGDKG